MIERNKNLYGLNTFGMSAVADYYIKAASDDDVMKAIELSSELNLPLLVLSGGSNMLIVEDICGRMPKKAILSYKNKTFVVRNTHLLRNNVLDTADRMRKMLISGEEEANADFATCRHCVCDQTVCEYSFNNK